MQFNDGGTITEEHITASLLSAVEDKVRRRHNEQMGQNKAELDILQQSQRELTLGKNKIESILISLNKEKVNNLSTTNTFFLHSFMFKVNLFNNILFQTDLEQNLQVLKDKELELEIAVSNLSKEDNINIDDAVTTTAPLYKQ